MYCTQKPGIGNEPLHVAALGTSESDDALFGERVERDGVDALLIDHHEAVVRVLAAAHRALELDQLLHACVDELALGAHELLALLSRLVEEARGHLCLLVLHGHVARQYISLLDALLHVRVPRAVIQDNSTYLNRGFHVSEHLFS